MIFTKFSLKRPVTTALVILGIVVFGVFSIFTFDMALIPDIEMPMMLVYTVYPGASPESVDSLITEKIEDSGEALSGVSSVLSYSYENYSMVALTYDYDKDMNDAYTDLSAALDLIDFPDDAKEPTIIQMDVNAMDTITISATNDGSSDMMSYIENTVVPQLESVNNVAQVEVTGGRENYIRVQLDEDKMAQYGLNISMISGYIAAADYNVPAGTISAGSQDISVSTSASYSSIQDLENTALTTGTGAIISLKDVADVSMSTKDPDSISRYNGQDNISIGVTKVQSASTVTVCDDVKDKIKEIEDTKPGVTFDVSYDSGAEIISSLKSVAETLLLGVVLAMLVLFIFFGDIKASLIVGSSMPLSILATMVLMSLLGYSLNIITMGALVIAIGMIVDSSIVVIESCFRLKEEVKGYRDAALAGAKIVVMSITASTITTIVVYVPMALIQGLAGQMFSQLGMIIVFAMVASLISALTIVPLLFAGFKPKEKTDNPVNRFLYKTRNGYAKILNILMDHKLTTIFVCVLLLVGTFFIATTLDFELIPTTYDGSIKITSKFRSGTSLDTMDTDMKAITDMVEADENFKSYSLSISENQAVISATAVDDCKRSSEEAVKEYNNAFSSVSDMDVFVEADGGGSSMMSSYSTDLISVTITADDQDSLNEGAQMVRSLMEDTPGVLHVSTDAADSETVAHVVVDPLKAADVGTTPAAIAGDLYYTLTGLTAATMEQDGKEYDIILNYPDGTYADENQLLAKTITGQTGKSTTLGEIAHIEYDSQLQMITKTDGRYQTTISATADPDYKSKISDAIDDGVAELNFPEGVKKSESMMESMRSENLMAIFRAIMAGIFLVFLVMAMQFESPRFSLMVMVCIPFSLIGSFLFLKLIGSSLNMVSLMGFLMLMGIVVNNGILLVDTANQERENMPIREALIKAGQIRLRPILMTTLTTILAMIPMAFFSDNEMMKGMACVIIGGLVASTLLCLLMMPTFYLLIDKKTRKEKKRRKKKAKTSPEENAPDAE